MALGNSLGSFLSHISNHGYQTSNLYMVQIEPPPIFNILKGEFARMGRRNQGEFYSDLIDGMCDEITLPSKNLNTSEIKTFGTMYRYPTGTSYSEMTLSFMVDKYANIRWLYEKWLGSIHSDTSHHISYYKNLVSPYMTITKYERGVEDKVKGAWKEGLVKYENPETAVYRVYNLYPFNVGTMSLSSSSSQVLKFQVSFYYERYRLIRKETGDEAKQVIDNRKSFDKARGSNNPRMNQAISATKLILNKNSSAKKEQAISPFDKDRKSK